MARTSLCEGWYEIGTSHFRRLTRRSFLIHISPEGRDLAERLNRVLEKLEEEIRRRLSPRDLEGFHAVMNAVEEVTRVRLRDR